MSNPVFPAAKVGFRSSIKKKFKRDAVAEVTVGGLMTVLKVTKEASAAFPPLQSAAGGLLAIAEIVSKAAATQDNITELEGYVGRVNTMISARLPASFDRCPEKLRKRMQDMASDVDAVASELQELKLPSVWSRVATVEHADGKVQDALRKLSWLMNDFIVGGTIDIELAVNDLHFAVDKGFEHMDGRFDELGEMANEILNNQENHDGLPSPRHAKSARWDHHSNRVICEENTRAEVLDAVYRWMHPDDPRLAVPAVDAESLAISGPEDASVFWLGGLAGTGKSTIAQTTAAWCDEGNFLGASFFCSRDSSECSNLHNIFPTIAYQLGLRSQTFRERLADALRADRDVQNTAAVRQLEKLIVEPLRLVEDFPPSVVIIDALDECKDDQAISRILLALSHCVQRLRPLMFFITSRPEQHISQGFSRTGLVENTQHLVLNEIPPQVAERDICAYLQRKLADVARRFRDVIQDDWPPLEQLGSLVTQAHGLFIFAATAVKFIEDDRVRGPREQLVMLLSPQRSLLSTSAHTHLDTLYLQVLRTAFPEMEHSQIATLKMALGSLVLVRDRLSSTTLEVLLGLDQGAVRLSLRHLHSLVAVPNQVNEALRLIHPSLHDFLIDSSRCVDSRFTVDSKLQHTMIAMKCLETLNSRLRRDICDIRESRLNVEVPDLHERVAAHIPPHLQYACRHWASHLADGHLTDGVFQLLKAFCEQYLLHWLETLSLLGALGDALDGLVSVQASLKSMPLPPSEVPELLHDCERIIRYFLPGLGTSCLQAYHGIAPFCPTNTAFYRQYFMKTTSVAKLVIGSQTSWSPCIHTMEGHTGSVLSVAFSHQGDHIVSGSRDYTVRIWDARTGSHLQTFTGHSDWIRAVAFHPNGRYVFSASDDRTVVEWDTLTGGASEILCVARNRCWILALACSSDGKLLAFGTQQGQGFVWARDDGEIKLQFVLKKSPIGDDQAVNCLIFSRDAMYLICGSGTGDCTVWNLHNQSVVRTYEGHDSPLRAVALSPNESLVAGGYFDGTVTLWKFDGSRSTVHVLKHGSEVLSIQFSPTDDILASACEDGSICLWSPTSGQRVGSLLGHAYMVTGVSFSPDGRRLCSASLDNTVRIWEIGLDIDSTMMLATETSSCRPASPLRKLISHLGWTWSAPHEGELTRKKSGLSSVLVREGDPAHHCNVVEVVFSSDGGMLATAAEDGLLKLWDTKTGRLLRDFSGGIIRCISFPFDGALLVCGEVSPPFRIIVLDTLTGSSTVVGAHGNSVRQVAFLRDNARIISCSDDGTLRLWLSEAVEENDRGRILVPASDTQVWRLETLNRRDSDAWLLAFVFALSDDEHLVAFFVFAAGHENELRVLDLGSNTVTWSLSMPEGVLTSALFFASNGLTLAALSESSIVDCFDLSQSAPSRQEYDERDRASRKVEQGSRRIKFSPDGQWIITDSGIVRAVDAYTRAPLPLTINAARSISPSSYPRAVFLRDQWLWKTPSSGGPPRRVCWVPREYRHRRNELQIRAGSIAIQDNLVAWGTESGRVVLIDLSQVL